MFRKFSLCFLLGLSAAAAAQAQVPSEANTLIPGQTIERVIAGGETHIYQISLAAGQFVRVVVEQKGADVSLTLFGPDGVQLSESDLTATSGEKEPLSFQAKAAGDYRLSRRTAWR